MKRKSALKIDLRSLKREHKIEQAVDILWNRYKDELSITGEIYSHRTKQWESRTLT